MLDEPQDVLRMLLAVCETLDHLDSPEYPATVGRHSRAEIHAHISGARYQGQRVSPHWSKAALVEAYIAINRREFEGERDRLLRLLADYGIQREQALAHVKRLRTERKNEK
jgi:hypothetical protein